MFKQIIYYIVILSPPVFENTLLILWSVRAFLLLLSYY
jgi:hypothetical protein